MLRHRREGLPSNGTRLLFIMSICVFGEQSRVFFSCLGYIPAICVSHHCWLSEHIEWLDRRYPCKRILVQPGENCCLTCLSKPHLRSIQKRSFIFAIYCHLSSSHDLVHDCSLISFDRQSSNHLPDRHMSAPVQSSIPLANLNAVPSLNASNTTSALHTSQTAGQQQAAHPAPASQQFSRPSSVQPPPSQQDDHIILCANITNYAINASLVLTGVLIAVAFGIIAKRQGDQNLKATLWRDCVDLPVRSKINPQQVSA